MDSHLFECLLLVLLLLLSAARLTSLIWNPQNSLALYLELLQQPTQLSCIVTRQRELRQISTLDNEIYRLGPADFVYSRHKPIRASPSEFLSCKDTLNLALKLATMTTTVVAIVVVVVVVATAAAARATTTTIGGNNNKWQLNGTCLTCKSLCKSWYRLACLNLLDLALFNLIISLS